MSNMRTNWTSLAAALLLGACSPSSPEELGQGSFDIFGGKPAASCAWPTTVHLAGCTGTLVHPEIVVLAAHCVGLEPDAAIFADDYTSPELSAPIESCTAHPNGTELGSDIGFCKLAEPVTTVPIVPLLAGCETSVIQPGAEVVAVGFGESDDTLGPGPKREVALPIVSVTDNDAFIGGNGKDTCTGDSGGPVFIRAPDQTWRLFAVTSYGNTCGEGGHYSLLHPAHAWLEKASGVDLTPCHAGTTWKPTAACGAFPQSPELGGGSWSNGCATPDVTALSQTCGAPFDPNAPPPAAADESNGCSLASRPRSFSWLFLLALASLGALFRRRHGQGTSALPGHSSRSLSQAAR